MNKKIFNIGSTFLISIAITACSASGGPGKSKQKEFAVQGCVGGGLLGAAAVTVLGSGENAGKAAVFGCGIGAVIGYTIAKRTDTYVSASDAISSETQRNIDTVNLVRNNNQKLATRITKYRSTLNTIKYSKVSEESSAPTADSSIYESKITELEQEKNILSSHVQSLNAMNASI